MKTTKNIGMLLLAVYLIIDGLLGFGLNLGPAIFLPPAAYKDIDAVMTAQRDLVEVVHTLKQVVCVKG